MCKASVAIGLVALLIVASLGLGETLTRKDGSQMEGRIDGIFFASEDAPARSYPREKIASIQLGKDGNDILMLHDGTKLEGKVLAVRVARPEGLVSIARKALERVDLELAQTPSPQPSRSTPPGGFRKQSDGDGNHTGGPVKTSRPYVADPRMAMNITKLRAMGLFKNNEKSSPIGETADIQVTDGFVVDGFVVTGVPVEYIKACARYAGTSTKDILDKLPGKGGSKRWRVACAMALTWTMPRRILLAAFLPGRWQSTRLEFASADGLIESKVPPAGRLWPSMAWLLTLRGLYQEEGLDGPYREPVSFATLLARFNPDVYASRRSMTRNEVLRDLNETAEEMVWTEALGLNDTGRPNVEDTRRLMQAAILRSLKYDVEEPKTPVTNIANQIANMPLYNSLGEFSIAWQLGYEFGKRQGIGFPIQQPPKPAPGER